MVAASDTKLMWFHEIFVTGDRSLLFEANSIILEHVVRKHLLNTNMVIRIVLKLQ